MAEGTCWLTESREEATAQFPYVEFTGRRNNITCHTCPEQATFPHSILMGDDGIKVMKFTFNKQDSLVILTIAATLKIRNSNFYLVAVSNLFSQVQYMKAMVGTYGTTNISLVPLLSEQLDFHEDFRHWPCAPELLEDATLCGRWPKFHSCLTSALGSPLVAPVEERLTNICSQGSGSLPVPCSGSGGGSGS